MASIEGATRSSPKATARSAPRTLCSPGRSRPVSSGPRHRRSNRWRNVAQHHAGQAAAERHLRGVQRSDARRTPELDAVLKPRRGAPEPGPVGRRLQLLPAALRDRLPNAGGLCRQAHRNGRQALRIANAPPAASCSVGARAPKRGVGSAFKWMIVGGQSTTNLCSGLI